MTKTFATSVVMMVAAATVALAPASASAAPVAVAPASASAAPVAVPPRFELPAPSGPHAVGRDVLHLVDQARHDPWAPGKPRELMVSMFYPASARPGRTARYLTTEEARLLLEDRDLTGVVDPSALSDTRSAAHTAARPHRGRYPLVVLSPGFTLHRHTLTNLAEELASRGYITATVDHAYESSGTAFPGGRVLTCAACTAVEGQGREGIARVATGRAADITFLLDRLTGARPAWRHAGLIDRTRIGLAGHSIGGNAAAATMAADPRVRAGVNMDGTFFAPVPETGLDARPFLMLGTPDHNPTGTDDTWARDWHRLDGWKRWLTITGTGHLDFTDTAILADQAGLPDTGSPLPGTRTAQLVRAYVAAFFDLHLRGIPQPLLAGPSPQNPEVTFHQPPQP
jgi:predicted dienelactone hydrolase